MSFQPPLLEEGKPPINKLRIAALISAGAIGITNILTLTGIIPVETNTQVGLCSSIILPIILGLASMKKVRSTPIFDEASKDVRPGSPVTKVTHSNLTRKTTIEIGHWTDEDRKRMDDLDKKLK